jgi:hypothetical protein
MNKLYKAMYFMLQVVGDIFSFGAVTRAMNSEVAAWKTALRFAEALEQISNCETASANATVKRMAKIANEAFAGVGDDR